jgi:dihydrofolate reductase
MSNIVFIATSIDGYIAKKDGDINWLHELPNPEGSDFGYADFIKRVDALLMGRNTFEKILSFGIDWPYEKKVFVLSSTLKNIPAELSDKVEIINGKLEDIIDQLNSRGFKDLYIDGGKTIQSLLSKNLIDELIISRIPTILGEGIPLFSPQALKIDLKHIETKAFDNGIVKSKYIRE